MLWRINHDRLAVLDLDYAHAFGDVLALLIEANRPVKGHNVSGSNRVANLLRVQGVGLFNRAMINNQRSRGLRRMIVWLVAKLFLEPLRVIGSGDSKKLVLPRHV